MCKVNYWLIYPLFSFLKFGKGKYLEDGDKNCNKLYVARESCENHHGKLSDTKKSPQQQNFKECAFLKEIGLLPLPYFSFFGSQVALNNQFLCEQ